MTLLKEQHFKHDTPDAWITAWPLPGRILSRGWCIFLQLRLFALLLHSLRVLLNDCIEGFRLLKPHQTPTPEKLPLVVSQDIVPVVLLPQSLSLPAPSDGPSRGGPPRREFPVREVLHLALLVLAGA